jgi:TonB family protein
MTRMSGIRYVIVAVMFVSTLWAQTPAAPAPPASQSQPPDASILPAASPSAPAPPSTPPPDSTRLELIKKVKPEYPPSAVPDKLQGQVIVRIVVNETGDVDSAEVISGNPVLAAAAVDAVKQWKFKPFIKNGQPVKAAVKLPFDFAPPADAVPDAIPKPSDEENPHPVRVSAGVMRGMSLHTVDPVYPAIAKSAGVQGTVVLGAIIGKDGTIEDLHFISGDPLLTPAAIEAVKTWRYRPYLLNGEPVKVSTEMEVHFVLSGR